ncbi:MAG: universal stress protein [Alphaproteobacteria bacterium]
MSIGSIIVHVDSGQAAAARVRLAAALAAEHEAHLTGLHPRDAGLLPLYFEASAEVVAQQRRWAGEEAAMARRIFEMQSGDADRSDWQEIEGRAVDVVIAAARWADIAIVGQTDPATASFATPGTLPEDVVLAAGRPVLVVPPIGAAHPFRRVLVGWNGSREAARAVHDALPLLRRADIVTVLAIVADRPATDPQSVPCAEICQALARHGVRVEAARTVTDTIEPGEFLLSEAAGGSADLIVMGAYGHSRLREAVLGGATRTILRQMTVPVLLSH